MAKINKKSVLLALTISLLFVLSILASACGTFKPTPWNKTLTFSRLSDIDIIYVVDGKNMKLSKICVDYFDNINWENALGKTKEEVGSGSNGFELIKNKLLSQFNTNELSALMFEFKSAEEHKVLINGQELDVKANGDSQYTIIAGENENLYMTVAGTDQDEFVFYNSSNLKLPTLCAILNLELDKTVLVGSSEYATNGGSLSVQINAYFK